MDERYILWGKALLKEYGVDYEDFDLEAELDSSISWEENKTILKEKLKYLGSFDSSLNLKDLPYEYGKMIVKSELLKVKTIAIYGICGSGKTSLAYKVLELLKDRPIYIVKHPYPPTITKLGYKNMQSLEDLERMQDCIVYWDEPQLSTGIYSNKTNDIIAKVCSIARQRNITIIISSSDTRVFTKHNESYFDLWLIKDLEYSMIKNGSKIKDIIRKNTVLSPDGFRLNNDEFVSDSRLIPDMNGKHTFKLPIGWSDSMSKPYRLIQQGAKTEGISANEKAKENYEALY